jgi:hypothetical protein
MVGQVTTERNVILLSNAKPNNAHFNTLLPVKVKEILCVFGEDFIGSLCQKHFL